MKKNGIMHGGFFNRHASLCIGFLLFLFSAILIIFPEDAEASAVATILSTTCRTEIQNALTGSPPGITKPVVVCLKAVVDALGTSMVGPVVNGIRNTVATMMAIAVAIISLRIMFGSMKKDLGKELSVLMLKMAAVSYFALGTNFIDIKDDISRATSIITDTALEVLPFEVASARDQSFLSDSGGGRVSEQNPMAAAQNLNSNPTNIPGGNIWLFVDEMIRTLLGVSGTDAPGKATERIAINGAFLFIVLVLLILLGPIGTWVVMIGLCTVIMTFFSLAMAVYMYIAAMVAILFLTAIGPMIIPLILFKSWGHPIFKAWVSQVISYSMQPMILTVFFVFMLNIMFSVIYDLDALYLDAYNTMNDPNKRHTITGVDLAARQVRPQDTGESERTGWVLIDWASDAGDYVYDNTIGAVVEEGRGLVREYITFPFLDWTWARVKEFAITMMLGTVTMLVMFTFQKQLPSMVTELVGTGDSTIPKLANAVQMTNADGQKVSLVEGMGDRMKQMTAGGMNAMRGAIGKGG